MHLADPPDRYHCYLLAAIFLTLLIGMDIGHNMTDSHKIKLLCQYLKKKQKNPLFLQLHSLSYSGLTACYLS